MGEKEEFNVGLDFSVLKGRLIGTIDYYVRHTKDLLNSYTVPVPPICMIRCSPM